MDKRGKMVIDLEINQSVKIGDVVVKYIFRRAGRKIQLQIDAPLEIPIERSPKT